MKSVTLQSRYRHPNRVCIAPKLTIPEPYFSESTIIGSNNIEICALTLSDETFNRVMSEIQIQLADGRGFQWLLALTTGKKVQKNSGSDVYRVLIENCVAHERGVLIYGGSTSSNDMALEKLKVDFPKGKFYGASPEFDLGVKELTIDLRERLERDVVGLCLVCLGAPKQEYVSYLCHKGASSNTVFLCAGGTVDFISGKVPRAPKIMRFLGLEWTYRLFHHPAQRVPRIVKALKLLVLNIGKFSKVYY